MLVIPGAQHDNIGQFGDLANVEHSACTECHPRRGHEPASMGYPHT